MNSGETQTFEFDQLAELQGADRSDLLITEKAASATQSETGEFQLSFEEAEIDFVVNSNVEEAELLLAPVDKQYEDVSLPAALIDEKLLSEISAIPNRMGFKIGDVADILGIKQYVLRYWETEFEVLRPKKAANNQRMYTRKDVENALLIRKLLHRDRFSIEGARNAMKELKFAVKKEKEINQVMHKIDNLNGSVDDLVSDIRKLRQLFI